MSMNRIEVLVRLKRIPLVRHAFEDPHYSIRMRRVDKGWYDSGQVPANLGGFNPHTHAFYCPSRSMLKSALENTCGTFNPVEIELFTREVLWFAHDYLHSWCYRAVQALRPSLALGSMEIHEGNSDLYAMLHLLSEVVAVVGLDYWCLCNLDFGELTGLGMPWVNLAAKYHVTKKRAFLETDRVWAPEKPEFFLKLARYYLYGKPEVLKLRSEETHVDVTEWMEHERSYSPLQRAYSRTWIRRFSRSARRMDPSMLISPFGKNGEVEQIAETLGTLLWEKCVDGREFYFPRAEGENQTWRSAQSEFDPRYSNVEWLEDDSISCLEDALGLALARAAPRDHGEIFDFLLYQLLCRRECVRLAPAELLKLATARSRRDLESVAQVVNELRPLGCVDEAPRDLMILN